MRSVNGSFAGGKTPLPAVRTGCPYPLPAKALISVMAESDREIPQALVECRAELDRVDEQLIRLLKQRLELGLRAARIKHEANLPIVDPEREAMVIAQASDWANEAGLAEEEVADVFARLISLSRGAQLKSV